MVEGMDGGQFLGQEFRLGGWNDEGNSTTTWKGPGAVVVGELLCPADGYGGEGQDPDCEAAQDGELLGYASQRLAL